MRQPFELIKIGLSAISHLRPIVSRIARHDPRLAEQLRKALTGAPLLAAEGNRARKNNRTAKLQAAGAEAAEAETALQVAIAWGYVELTEISKGLDALDHFQAVVRKLVR